MPGDPDPSSWNLDGRELDLVSSTASVVDPEATTRFRYREDDGLVWGDYRGGTVVAGRFVGVRSGTALTVSFVHRTAAGALVRGDAESSIERGAAGLRLVERFEVAGEPQVSVCEERDAAGPGRSASLL